MKRADTQRISRERGLIDELLSGMGQVKESPFI
jgi:hypothetical protein